MVLFGAPGRVRHFGCRCVHAPFGRSPRNGVYNVLFRPFGECTGVPVRYFGILCSVRENPAARGGVKYRTGSGGLSIDRRYVCIGSAYVLIGSSAGICYVLFGEIPQSARCG
jgi:hypothetical protein